jgi:Beta-lactamase superfamily domain
MVWIGKDERVQNREEAPARVARRVALRSGHPKGWTRSPSSSESNSLITRRWYTSPPQEIRSDDEEVMAACPKCTHHHIVKSGKVGGIQRWLCRSCGTNLPAPRRVAVSCGRSPPPCFSMVTGYLYVSDTMYFPELSIYASGADCLIAEATFLSTEADLATEAGHMTAAQAATIARDAGAGVLYLNHLSQRYAHAEHLLLDEARRIFPATHLAYDLHSISV